MRNRKVLAVIGVTFVLSVGAAFTAPPASAEAPLPIRIGYQATVDWLLMTAREMNLFEKEGLAPEYVKFVAGTPMIAAMKSQSIDIAIIGTVPFLLGLAQDVDWVLIGIGEGAYSEGLVVRRDNGIDTPLDLKGKRIGVFKGSTAHYGGMMILRQHGIRANEVNLVHMPPAEQLAALAKKEIDAAMVWEPWIQKMIHEADAKIIAIEGDLGIYTNGVGYSVRRDWLRDNRETAVRFLRALLMAYDVLQKNRAFAISIGARELEISEAWAETIYQNIPPPNMSLWIERRYRYSLVKEAAFHRRLGYVATFLFEEKIIPNQVDLGRALDASVIAEVLRTKNGKK